MPEFRVVTGYGRSFNYKITDDVITIGRSKDNHVVLFDHTASRGGTPKSEKRRTATF